MSTSTLSAPPPETAGRRWLTTADVAERVRRSPQTVRFWVAEEGLPAHRVTRRLYFDEAEVEAWMLARRDDCDPPAPDDHRAVIKQMVDAAPGLTDEQAARIRAVLLSGGAA